MIERERKSLITEVKKIEPVRFSDEAREWLEKEGYFIHTLTGQTIKTLREAARPFPAVGHKHCPDVEDLPSRLSEAAINPNQLFLPKSKNKVLFQQLEMMSQWSQTLLRKVKGVKVIVGEAPDYAELVFRHLDVTGQHLFGEDFDYDYTRSLTPAGSYGALAIIGCFDRHTGLEISAWKPNSGLIDLGLAPLIVPDQTK